MTEFRNEKLKIKICDLGEESTAPTVFRTKNVQQIAKSNLGYDDEVYVGYGFVEDIFPYTARNMYDNTPKEREIPCCILENSYLKATFLPTLGGRLWSLFDKKAGRDLLLTNDTVTFGNLAVGDAWFCGGVEWNFGIVGHNIYTCSQYHTAILKNDDGNTVLRFYEYERIRGCIHQMDFWLPDNSDRLFAAIQIFNPNQYVTPVYWWSNIAVEEYKNGRVIVPATEAYIIKDGKITKSGSLNYAGVDVTYPTNIKNAADHFFVTKNAENKFICALDENGYGLCQASTSRQQGRKLFVWGQHKGSKNWQERLRVCGNSKHYIEIQSGIAQTQYECLPMAPGARWQWVESYGAVKFDKDLLHGDYKNAVKFANNSVVGQKLEDVLINATHLNRKADEILYVGNGWGALAKEYRANDSDEYPFPNHLDFGSISKPQMPWHNLLKNGTIGSFDKDKAPVSWTNDSKCIALLENSVKNKDKDNWYAWLQLGASSLSFGKLEEARKYMDMSLSLCENAWSCYVIACLEYKCSNNESALKWVIKSVENNHSDASLIRENFKILFELKANSTLISLYDILDDNVKSDGRVMLYLTNAYLGEKKYTEVGEMFEKHSADMMINVREGEILFTNMWIEYQKAIHGENAAIEIPQKFEFRMSI